MPSRIEILRPLESDSASTLFLVREERTGAEAYLRRFKTKKQEEIEGLKELFTQLSVLQSTHLDTVEDFGVDKEGFFTLIANPPPGETLSTVLERGPLTVKEFETVAVQLLEALEVLHEQAIVHGSLRPDVVRIAGNSAASWQVTIHGFGQGFASRDDTKEEQIRAYRCTAPEQWLDGTTRRRTDVYSLGCVLYEALTARPPFDGRALKELRTKHLGHDVPPLKKTASHVPAWMCSWVMHLMAADPEQRPRKATAARELFERREAPGPVEPPPAATVPATPAPSAAAPQVSAPVVLPTVQPAALQATSSTIPIAVGPHVAATAPKRPMPAAPVRRKPSSVIVAPTKPSGLAAKKNLLMAAGVVLLLLVFILPRCGG